MGRKKKPEAMCLCPTVASAAAQGFAVRPEDLWINGACEVHGNAFFAQLGEEVKSD